MKNSDRSGFTVFRRHGDRHREERKDQKEGRKKSRNDPR